MDWSNERYVRLYTRTTADLLAFGWEGRLVWYELLRAADRAGVIVYGGDLEVMHEMLRVPREVWLAGWPRIVARGSAQDSGTAIILPNLMPANEATQSDRARAKASRENRRARHMRSQNVTERHDDNDERHDESQPVTKRDASVTKRDSNVTSGHADVTRCHSDAETEPCSRSSPREVGVTDVETAAAKVSERVWFAHCDRHAALFPDVRPKLFRMNTAHGYREVRERARDYQSAGSAGLEQFESDAMHVIAVREAEAQQTRDPQFFGESMWRAPNFSKAKSIKAPSSHGHADDFNWDEIPPARLGGRE